MRSMLLNSMLRTSKTLPCKKIPWGKRLHRCRKPMVSLRKWSRHNVFFSHMFVCFEEGCDDDNHYPKHQNWCFCNIFRYPICKAALSAAGISTFLFRDGWRWIHQWWRWIPWFIPLYHHYWLIPHKSHHKSHVKRFLKRGVENHIICDDSMEHGIPSCDEQFHWASIGICTLYIYSKRCI